MTRIAPYLRYLVFALTAVAFLAACADSPLSPAGSPPSAPTVTGATLTNDTTPSWSWTLPDDALAVRYQLGSEDGSWQEADAQTLGFTPASPLTDGEYTLYVQAGNAAGWSTSGSHTTTVDTSHVEQTDVTLDGGASATIAAPVPVEAGPPADTSEMPSDSCVGLLEVTGELEPGQVATVSFSLSGGFTESDLIAYVAEDGTWTRLTTVRSSDGSELSVELNSLNVVLGVVTTNPPVVSLDTAAVSITNGTNGGSHTFTAAASDADGDPLSYSWSVDGVEVTDETGTSFTFSPSPEYRTSYEVEVTVSDGFLGASATATATVGAPTWQVDPSQGMATAGRHGARCIAALGNGGFAVFGETFTTDGGALSLYFATLNAFGEINHSSELVMAAGLDRATFAAPYGNDVILGAASQDGGSDIPATIARYAVDGTERWTLPVPGTGGAQTFSWIYDLVVSGDRAWGVGFGNNADSGDNEPMLVRIDLTTGILTGQWFYPTLPDFLLEVALIGDRVVALSYPDTLVEIDPETGAQIGSTVTLALNENEEIRSVTSVGTDRLALGAFDWDTNGDVLEAFRVRMVDATLAVDWTTTIPPAVVESGRVNTGINLAEAADGSVLVAMTRQESADPYTGVVVEKLATTDGSVIGSVAPGDGNVAPSGFVGLTATPGGGYVVGTTRFLYNPDETISGVEPVIWRHDQLE